jgi:hypothetical protein
METGRTSLRFQSGLLIAHENTNYAVLEADRDVFSIAADGNRLCGVARA